MKIKRKSVVKAAVYISLAAGFFIMAAYADSDNPSIGDVAENLTGSFSNLAKAISAISYLAGFGFTIASIFKMKQHKDNPQQIPITTGIAMLCFGVGLIFMPSIFKMGGATLFGTAAQTAGVGGINNFGDTSPADK